MALCSATSTNSPMSELYLYSLILCGRNPCLQDVIETDIYMYVGIKFRCLIVKK